MSKETAPDVFARFMGQGQPGIVIPDEYFAYEVADFCMPKHYESDLEHIILPHGIIMDRVDKLAKDILSECTEEPLVCVCVLKGGHQFFSDLLASMMAINRATASSTPIKMEFIRCKSYENEKSQGKVQILGGLDPKDLEGKQVLIVEDMIDTGRTMVKLLATLAEHNPSSLRVASLFTKRTPHSNGYIPHYVGFEVPNAFVVGYALDYNEHFRDLSHVGVLNDPAKEKYKV